MKFTGFNANCDGYAEDGIKLKHDGIKFTIPWKDINYILPEHNKVVLKSGKNFITENVKPLLCDSAYLNETRTEKVKFLDYKQTKDINIKIGIKDIQTIAFNEGGFKAGKRKIESIKEAEEKKRAANMAYVKGGCYEMGCGSWTSNCGSDETPVHEVCVDDFYIDKYEVTQKEYQKVTGNNLSKFKGDNNPVEMVTWNEAKAYCRKTGKRLPTEAEWEYAARSRGKKIKYPWGQEDPVCKKGVRNGAKFDDNKECDDRGTEPVGSYSPNGLGIYDMSGNVWEWVADRYNSSYYKDSVRNNPKEPSNGKDRVLRGGSWYNNPRNMRAANRYGYNPDFRYNNFGFRCAGTP